MKALVFSEFGGPEVMRVVELPVPEPGTGEVQVRVDGAGMNPVDWKVREGLFPAAAPTRFPAVMLREFSGVVSKVGPGESRWRIGDGVYGISPRGTAAEYTLANSQSIGPRPTTLDAAEAGVVPLAALTAWQALFTHGKLAPGQRVLIHAAAGGVGTFAVQFAKWIGATVIGTASANHHDALRELGADELVDYRTQRFDDVVDGVDLVLHAIGADAMDASMRTVVTGGRLVSILAPPDEQKAKELGITVVHFMMQPNTEDLTRISRLIDDGDVRVIVDRMVTLDQAAEAMAELQKEHTLGKVGVRLSNRATPASAKLSTEQASLF